MKKYFRYHVALLIVSVSLIAGAGIGLLNVLYGTEFSTSDATQAPVISKFKSSWSTAADGTGSMKIEWTVSAVDALITCFGTSNPPLPGFNGYLQAGKDVLSGSTSIPDAKQKTSYTFRIRCTTPTSSMSTKSQRISTGKRESIGQPIR